jgi:proline iminopeptidase
MLHQFRRSNSDEAVSQVSKSSLEDLFKGFGPNTNNIVTFNPTTDTYRSSYGLTDVLSEGRLERDNGHTVYYETFGDSNLPAVLLVHGGPGGPAPEYRQLIDPNKNHIIFIHQRGCGKSTPMGKLEGNNTDSLIGDFKAVLDQLGITKVAVQGHSWGGPLGLVFAATYPEMIDYVLLRGPSNGDKSGAMRKLHMKGPDQFPDLWQALVAGFTEEEKIDLCKTLHQKIVIEKNLEIIEKYATLNAALSVVQIDPNAAPEDADYKYNLYKLYLHYIENNFFIGNAALMEKIEKITAPIVSVHGRHDNNCWPRNSVEITQAAREGLTIIVEGGSHSTLSPPMINAMTRVQALLEEHFRPGAELAQKKTLAFSL